MYVTVSVGDWGFAVALPVPPLPLVECKLNFGLQSHLVSTLRVGLA